MEEFAAGSIRNLNWQTNLRKNRSVARRRESEAITKQHPQETSFSKKERTHVPAPMQEPVMLVTALPNLIETGPKFNPN
jgi:hypothetical protein